MQNIKNISQWYVQSGKKYQAADYLLYLIAYHTSPVLEKNKPAVVLSFSNERLRRLNDIWEEYKDRIPSSADYQYLELRQTKERTTVLFYYPQFLESILKDKSVVHYLFSCGYRKQLTLETALSDLKSRCQNGCPHEIGIFLGIPLTDVLGFIENSGKKALGEGYWKVYHDLDAKLLLFSLYQQAKEAFRQFVMTGKAPEEYLNMRARTCATLASGE